MAFSFFIRKAIGPLAKLCCQTAPIGFLRITTALFFDLGWRFTRHDLGFPWLASLEPWAQCAGKIWRVNWNLLKLGRFIAQPLCKNISKRLEIYVKRVCKKVCKTPSGLYNRAS
jgi:hypothetical protein